MSMEQIKDCPACMDAHGWTEARTDEYVQAFHCFGSKGRRYPTLTRISARKYCAKCGTDISDLIKESK